MKIKMSFEDKAKKALVNSICLLLEKNPENNIPKIFKLSKALTKDDTTKKILRDIEKSYEEIPSVKKFFDNSLLNINPEIKRTIFMNLIGNKQLNKSQKKYLPLSMILSPDNLCNLSCLNCTLSKNTKEVLKFNDFDKMINNIHNLGINVVILFGGEPFLIDFIYNIYEKYNDIIFTPVTNGTLFTEITTNKLLKLGNVIPIITLSNNKKEVDSANGYGTFDKVIYGMNLLQNKGIPFGVSTPVSSENLSTVTSDKFVDMLINNGSKFSIYSNSFCSNAHICNTLSVDERISLESKINVLRNSKPYFFIDLFNDYKYIKELLCSKKNAAQNSLLFTKIPYKNLQSISIDDIIHSSLNNI